MQADYTVTTEKSFDEAVDAVKRATDKAGFKVQFVHDVAATLAEKGFARERVTIVEICNAKYASRVLAVNIKIGLMLPCPIMVYVEDGSVFISTILPTLMGSIFPKDDIDDVAAEVEAVLVNVIDEAAA